MTARNAMSPRKIDREIIRMTVPTVLSNIMVPLLALCDTAVAGHMPGEIYLAGVALGAVMVSTAYWLFSFLRAGTSGITAVAFGASDRRGMALALIRSLSVGALLGLLILAVRNPLKDSLLTIMGASDQVTQLAGRYFSICICGAVPMMLLTAVSGWLVGMQSTGKAMIVNISVSVLNVILTLCLVYGWGWGFDGIPYGTVMAQWLILIPAAVIVVRLCKRCDIDFSIDWTTFLDMKEWKRLFDVNSNLFLRSACMIAATMILNACGARLGDVVIGANAVINQLFLFFSYFMDGFAFTGEAMVGRFEGAGDNRSAALAIRQLLKWTALMTLIFVTVYALGLHYIVMLLSDSQLVAQSVESCLLWVLSIPIAGAFAFIFDGFYVGLTNTRLMLLSTVAGVAVFIVILTLADLSQWMLWLAFTCYLASRSLVLIILFPKKLLNTSMQYD